MKYLRQIVAVASSVPRRALPSCGLAQLIAAAIFLVPIGLARHASAADWPEFRGPAKDGIVRIEGLPVEWETSGESVQWRTELPGQGWSSPIVTANRIYLTSAIEGEDGAFELVALVLDAASGQVMKRTPLFEQPASAPQIHKKNSHASPTPVFDGEHVYVHFGHQGTACLSLDGDVVWKTDAMAFSPVHGNGGSPIVFEDLLIFSRDGAQVAEIVALNKRTGDVEWQVDRNVPASRQFSFCTPTVLNINGQEQLIFPGSNVVQSLDPRTGKELWRVTYEGYSVIPRPIYESGLVFVCTGYDRSKLLAIDPTGSGNVTATHVKWQATTAVPYTPSLIGHNGRIMMVSDNGIASALDAASGELIWKERIGGNFSASPLLVGNLLYLLSEEGVCTILDVSGEAPKQVAQNKMNERSLASFAVVDNDLLIRTAPALYRISR